MTRTPGLIPLARGAVALAVRALRDGDDQVRYRDEFLADLHGLPPADQLRYTAGVLSQTLALRAALGSAPSRVEEDAMTITRTRFYWRCRVFRFHHWVARSTEDGVRYLVCSRCDRDKGEASWGPDNTIGL